MTWKLKLREVTDLPRSQSLSVAEPQLGLIPEAEVWPEAVEKVSGGSIFPSSRVVPFSSVHVKCHQNDSLLLIWLVVLFLRLI